MTETIFWWVFTLACVFTFFFSYGMVEDLIRGWLRRLHARKIRETFPSNVSQPYRLSSADAVTTFRGYDTPQLFREDTLIRIKRLKDDIEEHKEKMNEITKQLPRGPGRQEEDGGCE